MPNAFVNGLNLHFEQAGSGPHLVLIHGLTGCLADWQPSVVPAMADRFTVLTYDLRGHGDSDMPPSGYTAAEMARDLVALLDDRGIDRAHLAGHSFGGAVALHLVVQHPHRVIALTISDSRIRTLQPFQKVKDWAYWQTPKGKEQLQQLGLTEERELDFSILETLMSGRSKRALERTGRWKTLLSSTTAEVDFRDPAGLTVEMISQLHVPTQAICAGKFSLCLPTLESLRKHVPSLKWTMLPEVGHLYPMTRPELFVEHVMAFHTAFNQTPHQQIFTDEASQTGTPTQSEG